MQINREQIIRELSEECGYYQKDVRALLYALDDLVERHLSKAIIGEDIVVQLVRGVKVQNHIVEERERINPKTRENIVCKPTAKPKAIFSETLRDLLQKNYDDKQ